MTGARTPAAAGKTRFDDIYDRPDPRAYFRTLAPLRYEIPQQAQDVFRRTLALRSAVPGTRLPVTVLDLCCSYGINAALLNHDLTLADLYAHYTGDETAALTRGELVEADKEFYAARRRPDAVPVIGLDMAADATRYALEVGLLDEAYAENLERHPPSDGLRRAMARVGLITVTGGIGYITHRTFDALLDAAGIPVWVSAFVLRTVPFEQILATLEAHGLATETDAERSYPQRLFTGPDEQSGAIDDVRAAGDDPTGLEAAGRYYARLYQARPRPA
ncbi:MULTISPECIES: hypothetical protein [Streptomyces]